MKIASHPSSQWSHKLLASHSTTAGEQTTFVCSLTQLLRSKETIPVCIRLRLSLVLCLTLLPALATRAASPPSIRKTERGGQLLVDGKPYLILGGELRNSSAGTAAQADSILPRLAELHLNTVLIPVSWDQIESTEGSFDFSILDHWIEVARTHHLHLVLLWFGSWKNAFSNYAPTWVKQDTHRFPRALGADGSQLEILSTFGSETLKADGNAFTHLMAHLGQFDREQQTVLMVQVENEMGYLGAGRDRSLEANRRFDEAVPAALLHYLEDHRSSLVPELAAQLSLSGRTWKQVFGDNADEAFMAWHYANYVQAVASAGKRVYALPMYVNAQLPAQHERAGEYPSGAPHPFNLDIYRAAAPSIDLFSPDIYWPDFDYWVGRYRLPQNPVFVPEARLEAAPWNALYAYGQAAAFGFSPFGIDSLQPLVNGIRPAIADEYETLDSINDLLVDAQSRGATRGLVLHKTSPRPTQTVALGGYLLTATISRSWPEKALLTDDGAMLVLQTAPDELLVLGSGLTVTFACDPDVDDKIAGIASIEEVSRRDGKWQTLRRLNGDQSNQGRQLSMSPTRPQLFRRVVLYNYPPRTER